MIKILDKIWDSVRYGIRDSSAVLNVFGLMWGFYSKRVVSKLTKNI